uniref:Small ribosomal subunit protein uS4 n=1 Tax=Fervidicoccus fontis TaxID=683846 RepID=A0A7J3ZLX0_9CREN
MGDPKKSRKKWEGPSHPWAKQRLEEELVLIGKYGLRNKRELWIAATLARKYRHRARKILALPKELREKEEKELLRILYEKGFTSENATLDDVLALTAENILERRLQTIVYKKGLARSIYQARQLIVHGHIGIGGRRVTSPGYLVSRDEERLVGLIPTSPMRKMLQQTSRS